MPYFVASHDGVKAVKEGWLRKHCGNVVKTWKRRFFVLLSNGQLQYFKSMTEYYQKFVSSKRDSKDDYHRVIYLTERGPGGEYLPPPVIQTVRLEMDTKLRLFIVTRPRMLMLKGSSDEETLAWEAAMKHVIAGVKVGVMAKASTWRASGTGAELVNGLTLTRDATTMPKGGIQGTVRGSMPSDDHSATGSSDKNSSSLTKKLSESPTNFHAIAAKTQSRSNLFGGSGQGDDSHPQPSQGINHLREEGAMAQKSHGTSGAVADYSQGMGAEAPASGINIYNRSGYKVFCAFYAKELHQEKATYSLKRLTSPVICILNDSDLFVGAPTVEYSLDLTLKLVFSKTTAMLPVSLSRPALKALTHCYGGLRSGEDAVFLFCRGNQLRVFDEIELFTTGLAAVVPGVRELLQPHIRSSDLGMTHHFPIITKAPMSSETGLLKSPYDFQSKDFKYPFLALDESSHKSNGQRWARKIIPVPLAGSLSSSETTNREKEEKKANVSEKPYQILLVGDILPSETDEPLEVDESLQRVFVQANLIIGNCESPVCHVEVRKVHNSKSMGLRRDMSLNWLSLHLSNAGIDAGKCVLSLANNHAGDCYGGLGLGLTVQNLRSIGAEPVGMAKESEPGRSEGLVHKVLLPDKTVIGIVAWSKWLNYHSRQNPPHIYRESDILDQDWPSIKKQLNIDILIGFPHWGKENDVLPAAGKHFLVAASYIWASGGRAVLVETYAIAHRLLGTGAFDIIAGHGTHTLQTMEKWTNRGFCAYSLGDFICDKGTEINRMGAALQLTVRKGAVEGYQVYPFVRLKDDASGRPRLAPVQGVQEVSRYVAHYRQLAVNFLLPSADSAGGESTESKSSVQYRICTETGYALGAATTSTAYIKLVGENGEGVEHELKSPHGRKCARGGTDVSLIAEERDLGQLTELFVRIEVKKGATEAASSWLLQHASILSLNSLQFWESKEKIWLTPQSNSQRVPLSRHLKSGQTVLEVPAVSAKPMLHVGPAKVEVLAAETAKSLERTDT